MRGRSEGEERACEGVVRAGARRWGEGGGQARRRRRHPDGDHGHPDAPPAAACRARRRRPRRLHRDGPAVRGTGPRHPTLSLSLLGPRQPRRIPPASPTASGGLHAAAEAGTPRGRPLTPTRPTIIRSPFIPTRRWSRYIYIPRTKRTAGSRPTTTAPSPTSPALMACRRAAPHAKATARIDVGGHEGERLHDRRRGPSNACRLDPAHSERVMGHAHAAAARRSG